MPPFESRSYFDPVSRYGPFWKVVDAATDGTAPQEVAGVVYPADGFDTRQAADRYAKRLNENFLTQEATAIASRHTQMPRRAP